MYNFYEKIINSNIGNNIYLLPIKFFFIILSYFFKIFVYIKNFLYDKKLLKSVKFEDIKIISIGNISAGGSGKTPFVDYLFNLLKKNNIKTAIITRGYKSKVENTGYILEKNFNINIDIIGDEPYLLYHKNNKDLEMLIGKNRVKNLQNYIQKYNNAKCFIMDDGFQHRKLYRDIDIVIIDIENLFFNSYLLPAGKNRETINSLKRADIILIKNYKEKYNKILDKIRNICQNYFFIEYYNSKLINNEKNINLENVKNKNVVIFSGLGNNEYFKKQIEKYFKIKEFYFFNDHYKYTKSDIKKILSKVDNDVDFIITTEKDYIKLNEFKEFANFNKIYYIDYQVKINKNDKFEDYILKSIKN